jgi:hypothetical protein
MEKSTMEGKYAENWAKYKRLAGYELFAVVGIVLIPLLLLPILFLLNLSWPLDPVIVVLFFAAAYFHYCRYIWPCPRCGERFNGRFGIGGIREKCQNCALPKWANDDEDDESTLNENDTRKAE